MKCEFVSKYILPAIRSYVAKRLLEKGFTQTDISRKLRITQPAVSQYVAKKRGKLVQKIMEIAKKELEEFSIRLTFSDLSEQEFQKNVCMLCEKIRKKLGKYAESRVR